jgi:dipeptidyl aminopeptidase/acylaminoacyl peptidase
MLGENMRNLIFVVLATLVFCLPQAVSAKPTLNDYAGLPDVSYASLSTDGRYVALTRPLDGQPAAFIYDIDNPGAPKVIGNQEDSIDMGNYNWLGPKHLVFTLSRSVTPPSSQKSQERYEIQRLASYNIDTGKFAILMSKGARNIEASNPSMTWVVNTLPSQPNHILMGAYAYEARSSGLQVAQSKGQASNSGFRVKTFKVNLTTGKAKGGEVANQKTVDIITNSKGDLIVRMDFDEARKKYSVHSRTSGKWKEIYDEKGTGRPFNLQGLGQTENTLIISRYGTSGFRELVEVSLDTGAVGKKVYSSHTYDFDSALRDPKTYNIIGVSYQDDYNSYSFIDQELKQWQAELKASFPGQHVALYEWNDQRTRFLVFVEGGGSAGEYHLFDTANMSLSKLGSSYPKIAKADIASVVTFDITASDGLKIPGYLTLPLGKAKAQGPFALVVMPHGGPEARDDADFDYWAQYLASRGYAVYQPNFRGSSGYGSDFRDAGYGEFGGKMVDDVIDGTKALIAQGIANSDKICIMGASYGGYSALASGIKAPDLYKCIISINGVTDVAPQFSWTVNNSGKDSEGANYWRRYMGRNNLMAAPGPQNPTTLWSPARQAGKIKAPVLIMHGNEDTNVPYRQFVAMKKALKSAGKDFEAISMKGNDHYLKTTEARKMVLGKSITFLDKHIGR